MTTTTATAGRALAERLGLKILGVEGHDLKTRCVSCKSSDAGRVHVDTGVFHCYSCEKSLNAFDLCKTVLGDHKAAVEVMVAVGLFQPYMKNGDRKSAAKNGDPQDLLAEIATKKNCTVEGFERYGARVIGERVIFPQVDADLNLCSLFWMSRKELKGRNFRNGESIDRGRVATGTGLFLPAVEGKYEPRKPRPGETWVKVEGVKDASRLSDLGYLAVGIGGSTMKPELASVFDGVDFIDLPDADESSWRGARKTCDNLQGHVASYRVARLPSEITTSHGEDVRDILSRFGDRGPDVIRRAIDEAEPADKAFAWMKKDGEGEEPPRFTELLDCPAFLALDLKPRFLVRDVLVAGQPAVVGGRSKAMKTSLATDLVVSLGSGSPFLGKFRSERVNVAFFTGESGPPTVRETALRQAAAKGVDLAACSIYWAFDLPKLSKAAHLTVMREVIEERKLQVVVVDPLYLALLDAETAGQAANLFAMGAALQPVSRMAQECGITLVVLHHFRKSGQPDEVEPAALEELSQSGAAEWARQWILLQRKTPYQADGHHELWMRCGGSAGHGSLWSVDIEEGTLNPDDFSGRYWDVTIQPAVEARAEAQREKERRRAADLERREGEHVERLVAALKKHPAGQTANLLRTDARLSGDSFLRAISALNQSGRVEEVMVPKMGRKYSGWALKT